MKKTLDKIRIHPEGWKTFLDEPGILSCEEAASRAFLSWELSVLHGNYTELHRGYHFTKRGQPCA
jgi:hypothetical protein